MDVSEASQIILNAAAHDYGNFYGGTLEEQQLGVGQIYDNIRYPVLNFDDLLYDTVEGLVLTSVIFLLTILAPILTMP